MVRRGLPDDCVLARTPAGTRKMRDRSQGLAARLRSVLFLVDGTRPVRAILDRAGGLRELMEAQFLELLELGLVECVNGTPVPAPRAAMRPPAIPAPESIAQIVGAKIRLLDALEHIADGKTAARHAAPLREARSWSELARRARVAAIGLQAVVGAEPAARFWESAKQILVASRDGAKESA